MSWRADKAWADIYMDAVRAIVGPRLLVDAPLDRDQREATDLIVLRARDMTIGVRMRRPGYAGRYPGQFTIRAHRDSGAETELRKIVNGWGDWLFYGHAGENAEIPEWLLVDLHALRAAFIRRPELLHKPDNQVTGVRSNGDGTHFYWFNALALPPDCLVARSEPPAWGVAA